MPDFGSVSPSAFKLSRCSAIRRKQHPKKGIADEEFKSIESASSFKSLDDYVSEWIWRKADPGGDKLEYYFPFLVGAKKLRECLSCRSPVVSNQRLHCSVRSCEAVFHVSCVKKTFGEANAKKFKCPHHECFLCKQKFHWKCVRCTIASHEKCSPWPEKVIHLKDLSGRAICWRHAADWQLDIRQSAPPTNIEEVFHLLPLPYTDEDFSIDSLPADAEDSLNSEPPPYTHIKRNVYLIKKKRVEADYEVGCTNCTPECSDECVCRVQCVSCSKACKCECSGNCNNRPFRKEKKTKIVKTALCGWGVEAAEEIKKKDFIIEYIGEVIDDALCEQRLWDMKYRGVKNFYMCEIRKDFTIDATFKGNTSRFLNHCCDPNCILEKWQVGEETRVGVFAARNIKVGEPLTYDYRFVQFGADVKCYCGAANCQGFLGSRRKPHQFVPPWGAKRRRSIA